LGQNVIHVKQDQPKGWKSQNRERTETADEKTEGSNNGRE